MKVMDDVINKEVQSKREFEALIGDLEMQWELLTATPNRPNLSIM